MLVVAALPDGFVKGRIFSFLDRADIFIGGHGFKPFDNRRNRGHICGIADLKNEMDMVGHDHILFDFRGIADILLHHLADGFRDDVGIVPYAISIAINKAPSRNAKTETKPSQ